MLKYPALHAFFKYLGLPTTPLLMVLVQFWDHFKTVTFGHITTQKWSHICTRTIRKCLFEDILFFGAFPFVIPIVNSISNLNHEGVELSCWNFFVVDQCTQRHNQKSQPACLEVFDKNSPALNCDTLSYCHPSELTTKIWHSYINWSAKSLIVSFVVQDLAPSSGVK